MSRVSKRGLWVSAILALTALLAGCGGGNAKPTAPATPTRATAPAVTTVEPTPASTPVSDLSKGIIVSSCEAFGSPTNEITAYDTNGVSLGTTSFTSDLNVITGDYSIGGCGGGYNGRETATAFDYAVDSGQPFTKFFASKQASDGSITIGYFDQSGSYTSLSKPMDNDGLGTIVKDQYPSYHSGTGRVYYWDMSADIPQLMSVSPNGGDNRPEKRVPGLNGNIFSAKDLLYMPDTIRPVAAGVPSTSAYNAAGTLEAGVWDGQLTLGSVAASNPRTIPIDVTGFAGNETLGVGFVPGTGDKTVVITDQVNLYQVTGGHVTTMYKSRSGRKIFDVTMAPNGDLAFAATTDARATSIYWLPKGSTSPKRVTQVTDKGVVNILSFSGTA